MINHLWWRTFDLAITFISRIPPIANLFDSSSCICQLTQNNWKCSRPLMLERPIPMVAFPAIFAAHSRCESMDSLGTRVLGATGVAKATKDALLLRSWNLLRGWWTTHNENHWNLFIQFYGAENHQHPTNWSNLAMVQQLLERFNLRDYLADGPLVPFGRCGWRLFKVFVSARDLQEM